MITLPPAPVCIAVSGHWMLQSENPSTIFVDRVDGLIWVVLLQKMHLLSESRLRSSLHEFKSLNCVHTGAVCLIWPYYIVDTNKSLLTGGWYNCLLRGSISAWQIQKWVLTVIHWTVHRVPNEGVRERTQGAEGVCSPIRGTTIWTNEYPLNSQGLNHQPKSTHGVTHGSSCICSRGWTSRTSMGGEALGPVKVLCPSVRECQDQEAGVDQLVSRGMGEEIGGFLTGNHESG